MFLWVRLVIFNLEDWYSEAHVRASMETLPEGLEALYVFSYFLETLI